MTVREEFANGLRYVVYEEGETDDWIGPHVWYTPAETFRVDGVVYRRPRSSWIGPMVILRPEETAWRGTWSWKAPCPTAAALGGHLRPHP